MSILWKTCFRRLGRRPFIGPMVSQQNNQGDDMVRRIPRTQRIDRRRFLSKGLWIGLSGFAAMFGWHRDKVSPEREQSAKREARFYSRLAG